MTSYPRPDSNGRVITSKCLQGACLKGVGKGGLCSSQEQSEGEQSGTDPVRPPPPAPNAGAQQNWSPACTLPQPPRASCLCNSPCNN